MMSFIINAAMDSLSYESQMNNIKFSIYIFALLGIFAFLWQKTVSIMKMDITKALGILYILPTIHLASHPEFILEIHKSSLVN